MANAQWADVEDFLARGDFESAAIAMGQIIKEVCPDIEDHQVEEMVDALHGELC